MKKTILLSLLVSFITISSNIYSQEEKFDFNTQTYFHDDSVDLKLDLFQPDSITGKTPLVIFVHGGGFGNGNRTHGHPFCQYMADSGLTAATISYTLYMKGKSFSCNGILTEKIKAIQLGAYHTRVATQWFINHADSLNIDTTKIFLAGSSAGAEAVLQAAYWDTGAVNNFPDTLSGTFKYAGVISGAGAILDLNMINEHTMIPTLCYHGTCDPLVPYHMAPHHYCNPIATGYMMFFGSLSIYDRITDLGGSCHLMSYCGDGHKHAGTPFYGAETATVYQYIQRVIGGEKFLIHRIFQGDENCKLGLDFDFCN